MNRLEWESYCRERRFVPIRKEETRHGVLLMAERYDSHDPGVAPNGVVMPHWKMMWLFERDRMDFVQWFACDWNVSREKRMMLCRERADSFVADNLEVARYG